MDAQPFELPIWESLKLVSSRTFGRLCVLDRGVPVALPMSYRLVGDETAPLVVVRTSPSSLIGRSDGPASLEVDDVDLLGHTAWSVLLIGTLRRVDGAHGLPDPQPWMVDERYRWMVLEVTGTSGRRFVGVNAPDGYSVDWEISAHC
jgi:Pyridoxamine 5'-phosphate oxidase